jgi:hypothetical protein
MNDLIALYRFAALDGSRGLSARLAGHLRSDPAVSSRADAELRALPRGAPRWSPGGEQAVARALARTIEAE